MGKQLQEIVIKTRKTSLHNCLKSCETIVAVETKIVKTSETLQTSETVETSETEICETVLGDIRDKLDSGDKRDCGDILDSGD